MSEHPNKEGPYCSYVIMSDKDPLLGWHSVFERPDAILYIPAEHHIQKWWTKKPITKLSDMKNLNEVVRRDQVCTCCMYYDRPGYIWNANHWMKCPQCNRTEVEQKTGLVTDSISVEAWQRAYIGAYNKKVCACPFCGEEGFLEEEDEDFQDDAFYVHMRCGKCKTRWMDRYVHDSIVVKDRDDAS